MHIQNDDETANHNNNIASKKQNMELKQVLIL